MTNSTTPRQTQPIQSLDRRLVILEAVANSSDPISLNELTDLAGIDRSSVFRLAFTLKRRGFWACPTTVRTSSLLVRLCGGSPTVTIGAPC